MVRFVLQLVKRITRFRGPIIAIAVWYVALVVLVSLYPALTHQPTAVVLPVYFISLVVYWSIVKFVEFTWNRYQRIRGAERCKLKLLGWGFWAVSVS